MEQEAENRVGEHIHTLRVWNVSWWHWTEQRQARQMLMSALRVRSNPSWGIKPLRLLIFLVPEADEHWVRETGATLEFSDSWPRPYFY